MAVTTPLDDFSHCSEWFAMQGRGCCPSSVAFLRIQAKLVDLAGCSPGDRRRLGALRRAIGIGVGGERTHPWPRPNRVMCVAGTHKSHHRRLRGEYKNSEIATFPDRIFHNVA